MAWVKLDDQFSDHPKVIACGPAAAWLYICGLGYCARLLTDGFIPIGQLRKLADVDDARKLAEVLVEVNLWERGEKGFWVHDYLDYQPSREKVLEIRAARAEAGRKGGKQKSSNLLETSTQVQDSSNLLDVRYDFATNNVQAKSYPQPQPIPVDAPASASAPAREGSEIPAEWPAAVDIPRMLKHGQKLGMTDEATRHHITEYHHFWLHATDNNRSRNWVARWMSRTETQARDGTLARVIAENGAGSRDAQYYDAAEGAAAIIAEREGRTHAVRENGSRPRLPASAGEVLPAETERYGRRAHGDVPRRS